jgi:hypothetical protein
VARDPSHPCFNPSLSFVPAIEHVDDVPSSPCELTKEQPEPVCTFGVSAKRARATIALVGDSHALHWRAAVDVVAKRMRWRGYSITTAGCFFSASVSLMGEGAREICIPWYASAQKWFRDHPQVSQVFVSGNAPTPVTVLAGQTELGVKSAGYRKAWHDLPRTVKHVIVIRDTPESRADVFDCLQAAVAAGTRPGPACPTPRATALPPDRSVQTVSQLHAARYRSVDLTHFFCGARDCYPVIGGVLVYRDVIGHITFAYSTSLGRYLLAKVRPIVGAGQ